MTSKRGKSCDREGCTNAVTGYDAWGEWCDEHNGGRIPESPCAICRSYGHFTHNHPEGYVNPMYDLLGETRGAP